MSLPLVYPTTFIVSAVIGITACFAGDPKPDVSPVISTKGELLFQDDFDGIKIKPEWVGLHGTQWEIVDGALKGTPSPEAYQKKEIARGNSRHSGKTPSSRLMVPSDDCILLFRFKLSDKLAGAHFGFNDGNTGTGHLARFIATRNEGLAIQKDKNRKVKGDKDETLATDDFKLKIDTWYWMMLEVAGDEMAAQVSGSPVVKAKHPRFDIPKGQINLPTRTGGVVYYDQVRVWKAIPVKSQ